MINILVAEFVILNSKLLHFINIDEQFFKLLLINDKIKLLLINYKIMHISK